MNDYHTELERRQPREIPPAGPSRLRHWVDTILFLAASLAALMFLFTIAIIYGP